MQNYSTVNTQRMRAVNRGTETSKNCIPSITKFPPLEVRLQRSMGFPSHCSSEFVRGRPFLGQMALLPFPTCVWTGRFKRAALAVNRIIPQSPSRSLVTTYTRLTQLYFNNTLPRTDRSSKRSLSLMLPHQNSVCTSLLPPAYHYTTFI